MTDRPARLHASNSFTRLDASEVKDPLTRSRANTIQGPPMPTVTPREQDGEVGHADGDIFAYKEDEEEDMEHQLNVPEGFDELPIEIRSLTERFLESLSAKVHPTPPTADRLSDLFQDFYTRASAKINTHIATLSARLTSDSFKKMSASSRPGSIRSINGESSEQQMLSATEMADRKRARRLLEVKRTSLEEAVERAVCEKVYDRIWRHRSTDDEERDHKLRSRTAALSLVGIGLKELLMTAEDLTEEERKKTKEREGEIREWLSTARDDILMMSEEKYPLGKLRHLTAAHKSIVEALSKIFPASSSADEILPTLIYTLITLEPSQLNAYSDLKFIQRFRGSTRMDGETAYCLVNLEAAVSFLETVDLSSLRAEEPISHEKSGSRPSTPQKSEITPMPLGLAQTPDLTQTPATPTFSAAQQPPSPGTKAQRRLSNLIQTQTNRIEAASDAVRESILDSADQALGRINNTLDTSFKFLFGRMKDHDPNSPVQEPVELPKTLEDARKLVSSPTRMERDDENASISGASSTHGEERGEEPGRPDLQARMTDLFGGRRQLRDRSVDSTQSGGSGKRTVIDAKPPPGPTKIETTPSQANTSAVDSIRNMGNSLNPLNRFANINVLPRFGRTVSQSTTPGIGTPAGESNKQLPVGATANRPLPGESIVADDKGARAIAAIDALKKTTPPVKRFLEAKDSQDLKLKEVEELLKEYQRLATALRGTINY